MSVGAALEQQRHDEVLLIVQVPFELATERRCGVDIALHRELQRWRRARFCGTLNGRPQLAERGERGFDAQP